MTCIVGLVRGTEAWIGGDSAGSDYETIREMARPKVFQNGEMVIGYTTAFRFGQLLEHSLCLPARNEGQDDVTYLSTTWVDAVRQCLKDGGWATAKDDQETGGTALIGYRGGLYELQDDYSVLPFADGMAACGSGGLVALAALRAMTTWGTSKAGPKQLLEQALATASALTPYVRPPFTVLSVKKGEGA